MKTLQKIGFYGLLSIFTFGFSQLNAQQQKLFLEGFNDANLNPGSGMLQMGETNGPNMIMDRNEILTRNNGAPASLFLNIEGGTVKTGNEVTPSNFWATGFIRSGSTDENPNFKFHHESGTIDGNMVFTIDLNLPAGVTTDQVVLLQCNTKNALGGLVPKTNYSYNSNQVIFGEFFDDNEEYHVSIIYID